MHSSYSREGQQMASQGWPGGFSGESGNVLVGLVELRHGLGSEELFGCDVEAVGVALDRLEEPGSWIVELAQEVLAETGVSSRPRIYQGVQVGDPLRHLDPERRRLIEDPERRAEPHRIIDGVQRDVGAVEVLRAGVGEWMQALPEQGTHLRGHRIASVDTVYAVHAGADPDAR